MRTVVNTLLRAMFSIGIAAGTGYAAPGTGPSAGPGDNAEKLAVQSATKDSCPARGGLCITAGSAGTQPAPSILASAPGAPVAAETSPAFLRVIGRTADADALPWTLDVSAAFARKSVAGNAMFILRDTQDPDQAPATHVVTALWQAAIPSSDAVAVRMFLSPQDGFHRGHTYQLRVVQLLDGKETDLATGEVRLL